METKVRCYSIKIFPDGHTVTLRVWDHTKKIWDGTIKLKIKDSILFKPGKKYKVTFKELQD